MYHGSGLTFSDPRLGSLSSTFKVLTGPITNYAAMFAYADNTSLMPP